MNIEPYHTPEDGEELAKACEPTMQEVIPKRRVKMTEVMEQSITLEESRKIMEERIYRFYHPEA